MIERLGARAILDRLVSFDTVSRNSNLALVDWLEEYLTGHGIACHRYWNEAGDKAALMAHAGPETEGAVVLSGHTDVVPVDGQPWDTDPFQVVEKDGKLYGRGTCDMKGFDALAVWALVEAHHAGVARPLQLALSFDEEVGCTGAPPMIDHMQGVLPKGELVIVGEPSMMKAVSGHKGGKGWDTRVVGFEVHSSMLHKGVNAIMAAAPLIDWANEVNAANMAAEPSEMAAMFDPPFTTAHVGQITGGTAHNITAKSCDFAMDFRAVPGEPLDDWGARYLKKVREVEAKMQAVVPGTRIEIAERFSVPGLKPEEGGAAETLVRGLTGDNASHKVSYGTEAGQFQERGYSAVICGPGDIAQAHQPNEFLSVAQFRAGEAFMTRLIDHLKKGS